MQGYRVVTRAEDLSSVAQQVASAKFVGLDIETYDPIRGGGSLDPATGEIRLVQLNVDDVYIYVIDLMQTGTLEPVVSALRDTKAVIIGHNLKFEQKWFWYKYRLELWPLFCTYRASVLLHNGRKLPDGGKRPHDLWALYDRELKIKNQTKDNADSDWSKPNLSQDQLDYAAEDVEHLLTLRKALKAKLAKFGLLHTALIEFGVILAEGAVELKGIPFDVDRWRAATYGSHSKEVSLRSELLDLLPHPTGQLALPGMEAAWNLDSQPQLQLALKRAGIHLPDTQKLTMGMYAEKYPIVKKIVDYRKYSKRVSSFGEAWLRWVKSDGRIHPEYYALLAAGRYSNSKPNCFDGETEILTRRGWVRFDTLLDTDEVAQWEPSGAIRFVLPTAHVQYPFDGEMIHVENKHIDLFMTPDHRCLLKNRRNGSLRVMPAADYASDMMQLHAGVRHDGTLLMSEARLGVLFATQADGSWHDSGVEFAFKKQRKWERLCSFLDVLGAPYSRRGPDSRGRVRIRIKKGALAEWLLETLGHEKRLPWWLLDLTPDGLLFACTESMLWDGHHKRLSQYSSTVKQNSDVVQAIHALCGKRAKVREYNNTKWGGKSLNYCVDVTHRDYSLTTNASVSWVPWSGTVYCVSVPSGYVVVRRNGKASITGQCQQIPRESEYRRCFRAPPGRVFILADYAGIEMRIVAEICRDPKLLSIFDNNDDAHLVTASLIMQKVQAEITKNERQMAKPVNFGFIYGMMPPKLVLYALGNYGVTMSEEQATMFRERYFARDGGYYGVKLWHDTVQREGKRTFTSRTLSGRIRYFDETAHNEYYNHPVQGTGADALKIALRKVHSKLADSGRDTFIVHHVHDEIILEADDDPEEIAFGKQVLCEGMTEAMQVFLKRVPVVVDPSHGPSWGEAKG